MNASVAVNIRIPVAQAKVIQRAAKARGIPLSSYVREVAYDAAVDQLERDAATTKAANE